MLTRSKLAQSIQAALLVGSTSLVTPALMAQESDSTEATEQSVERIAITGSRIRQPGAVSASPIFSFDEKDIDFLQEPEMEKVLRVLPSTIPGDGGNVNNGTAGAATIDLRGLGPERNLVLLQGRRMVPFNFNGEVDTATIPTALVERVDVVTGGASAVYGSDAIAGAVNFILKDDFEGVEFEASHSQTGDSDGDTDNLSLTLGSSLADDRGNVALSLSWMNRDPVMLGDRPLGLLGIDTATGANYEQFLNGEPPLPPPSGCGGPDVAASGGSTTAIPTRFAIVGGGAASAGQFREDGTIGDECSVFNFNPYNFYQTPLERYSATALAKYYLNDDLATYAVFNYTNSTVVQQVAPSGTFGQAFDLPLRNPLIGDQARQFMIDAGNTALGSGLLSTVGPAANWQDINGNGVVDADDYLRVQLRRRTVELGPRTERYDSNMFQMTVGLEGMLYGEWAFDTFFQYGESNRSTVRDGYTNLGNIQEALDTFDGVTCNSGTSTCVPINLFGGFGTITEEMAGFARAIALQTQNYEQTIFHFSVDGPVDFIELPTASAPLAMSVGYESRNEKGSLEPDECLKEAPSSCQGGAGGNLLPISGGYKVDEFFIEGMLPLLEGVAFSESLDFEFGFRWADYDTVGSNDTWKLGLSWRPAESVLVRVMQQQATRAPNVGELASPVVTGLDNAKQDPCSVANAANIDATLRALCISTGMTDAQVGAVQDVISGQVNTFDGSDPENLPDAEEADTFTAGIVWTPDFSAFDNFLISLDYYDIDITNVIGEFSAQEILDACYIGGNTTECAKINRIGGDLTISGAGIERFTTNLNYQQAEGLELAVRFGIDMEDLGDLQISANINQYLTQESLSSDFATPIECRGYYGTSCDPLPEIRMIQRTTWNFNDLTVSLQWRYQDAIDVEKAEAAGVYEPFRHIGSYSYFDLYASYQATEAISVSLGVDNLFEREAPVVGNEAGDTSSNSGNTFPSNYDNLGRIFKASVKVRL
ncbi:hypothetical protein DXV75_00350 [Alteromonas aestuariivivens]|uniref:TonB-dependent receptor n=1 Tax=Alteromonas aestuariivivens TaxID=1938339 RepID=A0A3D8MDN9_9ALTE|nr:TonB-dependent receptor [Alteromonas aestuariivivens]RDV28955.1 hypothetical protein DXV75_00350 [Alteromonas aestuariivivens]